MKYEEIKLKKRIRPSVIPILIAGIVIPASICLWILNHFVSLIGKKSIASEWEAEGVSPSRWLMSIAAPAIIVYRGLRKKSLDLSGAVFALVVGFFMTISSYCFFACLLVFFISSSKATKFRSALKIKHEDGFKEGGQRNWIQVLCNGGMATELALLYLSDVGSGQRPINFHGDYRASWLGIAILGAISCANGDTWASELGTVIGKFQPRLITSWKKVPIGTNGGVTFGGLIFSMLGGLVIGCSYYVVILLTVDSLILAKSAPQWPLIIVGGFGGFFGSLIDSILGATLQFSGEDSSGKIKEIPGPGVKHISGFCILDNHSINLLSTIFTALMLPSFAYAIWPLRI